MNKHLDEQQQEKIYTEFHKLMNMPASVLEKWLKTDESKNAGWGSGDGKSIGHKSGEKSSVFCIKKKAGLNNADYKHMQK